MGVGDEEMNPGPCGNELKSPSRGCLEHNSSPPNEGFLSSNIATTLTATA